MNEARREKDESHVQLCTDCPTKIEFVRRIERVKKEMRAVNTDCPTKTELVRIKSKKKGKEAEEGAYIRRPRRSIDDQIKSDE